MWGGASEEIRCTYTACHSVEPGRSCCRGTVKTSRAGCGVQGRWPPSSCDGASRSGRPMILCLRSAPSAPVVGIQQFTTPVRQYQVKGCSPWHAGHPFSAEEGQDVARRSVPTATFPVVPAGPRQSLQMRHIDEPSSDKQSLLSPDFSLTLVPKQDTCVHLVIENPPQQLHKDNLKRSKCYSARHNGSQASITRLPPVRFCDQM